VGPSGGGGCRAGRAGHCARRMSGGARRAERVLAGRRAKSRLPGYASACLALGWWLIVLVASVEAQPPSAPPQDPVAGSRVFGAKGCGRCHAIQGVGGTVTGAEADAGLNVTLRTSTVAAPRLRSNSLSKVTVLRV